MPILALDTATLVSSVALATADTLVAELTVQTKKTHSEMLMPHIAEILGMAQLDKGDLRAIAVSIGPGSFTGLRIGLATAKALAYALRIPLIGVSTLTALAFSCPVPGAFISPMLDAQKGNIYQSVFRWQAGELQEHLPARVISFKDALQEMWQMEGTVVALGDAALLHRQEIGENGRNVLLGLPHIVMPRAGSVAILGHRLLSQGFQHDAMTLEPIYIRRSEAEELWEKRQGVCSR